MVPSLIGGGAVGGGRGENVFGPGPRRYAPSNSDNRCRRRWLPRPDTQLLTSQFSQLLQSAARLVSLMSEVGAQPRAPITLLERERALTAISPPTTFEIGAIFSMDMTQQADAIFPSGAPQQPCSIWNAMQ
ncbi:unnamed protein product [Lampetra planeri]